jgi:hypothetical protein
MLKFFVFFLWVFKNFLDECLKMLGVGGVEAGWKKGKTIIGSKTKIFSKDASGVTNLKKVGKGVCRFQPKGEKEISIYEIFERRIIYPAAGDRPSNIAQWVWIHSPRAKCSLHHLEMRLHHPTVKRRQGGRSILVGGDVSQHWGKRKSETRRGRVLRLHCVNPLLLMEPCGFVPLVERGSNSSILSGKQWCSVETAFAAPNQRFERGAAVNHPLD